MTDEELKEYRRQREIRRMPGYKRLVAMDAAKKFSAAIRTYKRLKKKIKK